MIRRFLGWGTCAWWLTQAGMAADSAPAALPVLTQAAQVLQLTPEQAKTGFPLQLQGVVTYADANWEIWFLQDATAGLYLHRTNTLPVLAVGDTIEVTGISEGDGFAPVVREQKIVVRGRSSLPTTRRHSFDELAGGAKDSQWVEIEAIVRAAYVEAEHLQLELHPGYRVQVFIPGFATQAAPAQLVDARVRLRGVWASAFNQQGQLTGYKLFVPAPEELQIVAPAPAEAFALPVQPVVDALRFHRAETFGHRIKLAGVVTARESAEIFYLQDESGGLRVQTRQAINLQPGDRVEVAGFPQIGGATPRIEEAAVRTLGRAEPLPAKSITVAHGLTDEWDARLVSLEGELVENLPRTGQAELVLRSGPEFFTARLAGTNAWRELQRFQPGSRLAVTGVCSVQGDEHHRPTTLALILRGAADIRMLRPAPWWTIPRVLFLAGLTTIGLLAWRLRGLRREGRLQAQHSLILENTPDLVGSQALDGRLLVLNPAWKKLTGYPLPVLERMNLLELIALEHRAVFQNWWGQIGADRPTTPLQTELVTADGRRVWVEINSRCLRGADSAPQVESIVRDITERKRTDDALRRSEENYRLIVDHVAETVLVLDLNLRHTFASPSVVRLYGYPIEEFLALPLERLLCPESLAFALRLFETEMALEAGGTADPGRSSTMESREYRKDGTAIWVENIFSFIRDADGRAVKILCVAKDISDRKRADEAMRRSEELLRLANEAADLGIYEVDYETDRAHFSPELCALLGLPAGTTLTIGEALDHVHPDDRGQIASVLQRSRDPTGAGTARAELRLLRPDGTERWVVWRGATLFRATPAGRVPERGIGSVFNITDRKHTEEMLAWEKSALEVIASATSLAEVLDKLMLDLERHAPGALCSVLLLDPDGLHLRHGAGPTLPAEYNRAIDGVAIGPGVGSCGTAAHGNRQVIVTDISRDPLWADYKELALGHGLQACWSTPIHGSQGKVLGTFAIYYHEPRSPRPLELDLIERATRIVALGIERKRAESDRQRLETQLHQTQKMESLGTLAGGIAHDFNNLLAAIIGNTELAWQDVGPNHPARESLDEIRKAGGRARDLVQRILAFSRKQEPQRRPLQLQAVLQEAVKLLRSTIPAGVEIQSTFAPSLPSVLADASQVHQVIMNLATNAWHALDGGRGHIAFALAACRVDLRLTQLHASLHAGPYVRLSVTDTGKGMDAATLARIFDPFFTTKGPGQGTGLGLSVVHGIMEAHEGAVVVESELGRGATFHLYFPAHEGAAAEAPVLLERAAPVRLSATGAPAHILFLDDEESLVFLARRQLEQQGYRFTGFTRATDALAAFRTTPQAFDLVITDFNMPGWSGMDVARELLAVRPELRVVLVSGYLRASEADEARALGIREVLHKPAPVEELSNVVGRLLAGLTAEAT